MAHQEWQQGGVGTGGGESGGFFPGVRPETRGLKVSSLRVTGNSNCFVRNEVKHNIARFTERHSRKERRRNNSALSIELTDKNDPK